MGIGMAAESDVYRVAERLFYEVRNTKHDELFSGASAADLSLAIVRGTLNMVADQRTGADDLTIAVDNLQTLLAEMDSTRVQSGFAAYQEVTISTALGNLCPGFWPFC